MTARIARRFWVLLLVALFLAPAAQGQQAVMETERLMLTGTGPDDAVMWDFAIDGGMRAGEQATIAVPSNWQQQGFGSYQYGYVRGPRAEDSGVYRRTIDVPVDWQGKTVRIVFDGVMTDALVKVNDQIAGPRHQGGFSRFSYDVTSLIRPGETNSIEVQVDEASSAAATDVAERWGDYWVFGGIYRPAWLEARPAEAIDHVAIDAEASGELSADILLAGPRTVTRLTAQVVGADGANVGPAMSTDLPAGGTAQARLAGRLDQPRLWSAETPNLYWLDVTLWRDDQAVHRVRERFGFRTFELRESEGLYLNGQRVLLKGVNRHSFRADTGRSLSREDAYADVRLLRELNMNAVRMSHYAPEKAFLEAADELGLYVMNELSGWQNAHDTEVGRELVRELVRRDVNHPSILLWANGNEGGWNRELDADFALYDPQDRPVVHPWELFNGLQTDHYPRYHELEAHLAAPHLVLPTEFLHGLYDGGHGAGLDDYWNAMLASPVGAGGFLWNLADEGIARTDEGGRIEVAATMGPDGLIGPRHEPEPSYHTIKDIWSPVQVAAPTLDEAFDGRLSVANNYDFTSLEAVTFDWRWLRFAGPLAGDTAPEVLAGGTLAGPPIAPHAKGGMMLPLPDGRAQADALELVARNAEGEIARWVWATLQGSAVPPAPGIEAGPPRVEQTGGELRLTNGAVMARFDAASGLLTGFGAGTSPALSGGPRLVFARPATGGEPEWTAAEAVGGGLFRAAAPGMAKMAQVDLGLGEEDGWAGFTLQISADGEVWRTVYEGARIARDGNLYPFPAQHVAAVRLLGLDGSRGEPQVRSVRLTWQGDRFPGVAAATQVAVRTGTVTDPTTGQTVAWLEAPGAGGLDRVRWTLAADGTLALDYGYSLEGPVLFHGVGFEEALGAKATATALVRGPWPVWQNRLRGPELGVHVIAAPEQAGVVPADVAGYFADPRWLRLDREDARLVIRNAGETPYVQLGARLADLPSTSVDFPAGALGFLHAIPAMGAKFQPAELTGPAGLPAVAEGEYTGRLLFNLALASSSEGQQ